MSLQTPPPLPGRGALGAVTHFERPRVVKASSREQLSRRKPPLQVDLGHVSTGWLVSARYHKARSWPPAEALAPVDVVSSLVSMTAVSGSPLREPPVRPAGPKTKTAKGFAPVNCAAANTHKHTHTHLPNPVPSVNKPASTFPPSFTHCSSDTASGRGQLKWHCCGSGSGV